MLLKRENTKKCAKNVSPDGTFEIKKGRDERVKNNSFFFEKDLNI
jgi:hypothetical protein